ncbi:MAG: hypothetical protein WA191_24465 [Telluria sp.]
MNISFKSFDISKLALACLLSGVAFQSPVWADSSKVTAMRKNFETTPNYAAFIHDGMQKPDEGGRFYALIAFNRCTELNTLNLKAPAKADTNAEKRDQSFKVLSALKMRCAGVSAQFPDESTFRNSLKQSNARGAPDILLGEPGALAPRKNGSARAEVQRAKGTGDPYLLAATIETYVEELAPKLDPEYAKGGDRVALYTASKAATCEIVGDCVGNLRLSSVCAAGGSCEFNDYRDFLRAELMPSIRPLYDRTRLAIVKMAKQ